MNCPKARLSLTTMEAATLLGVSRQFLVNMLEKGEIAHHMVGLIGGFMPRILFHYKAQRDGPFVTSHP